MASSSQEITRLLAEYEAGDREALERLLPLVYDELRRLAAHYLRGERPGHTLQPTALVHEAWFKLVDQRDVRWQNRAHFLGVAAQQMRRILVDHARGHNRHKRGGDQVRLPLDDARDVPEERDVDLVRLDDALRDLAAIDPQQSRVVELRYFGGLTIEETAEAIGVSPATVKRDWAMARAWLHRALVPETDP